MQSRDRDAVYDICLRTGDAGGDARHLHDDPELLGHVWAGPYVELEPEHAFVVVDEDDVALGYVLGALDSRSFESRVERDWYPALRERYPPGSGTTPADRIAVYLLHNPPLAADEVLGDYPSHLHIDLLPDAQGQGAGRRLIETLCAALAADGSRGVHLGVSAKNERAVGFYRSLGFSELTRSDHGHVFGLRIDEE